MPRTLVRRAALLLGMLAGFGTAARAQGEGLASRSKGRADAPVTVFEMSDFQCPYCRHFALETLPALEREYVATGKVRLIFVNFPMTNMHANALAAAEVAICAAQQQKFWPVHDILFQRQERWAPLKTPRAYLVALADSAGTDHATMARCAASDASREAVQADSTAAARAGAHGTPTFYIEGGLIAGDAPAAAFREVIDSIYKSRAAPVH
jgi:protein-disulfide isomerase